MIDPMQQNVIDYLRKKAQGVPDVGNPPPPAVAPNPLTHASRPPYAGQDIGRLSYGQRQEWEKWMIDEASRLIASRQAPKPYKPFTPEYPTPEPFDAEGAQRANITQIASQLAASLGARDNPK